LATFICAASGKVDARFSAVFGSNDMMKTLVNGECAGGAPAMPFGLAEFVVQGRTTEGNVFQPGDWAEQLLGRLAGGRPAVTYASYLRAEVIDGIKSLVVRSALKEVNPGAFNLIRQFVADNHLMVRAGRGVIDAEGSGPHRAIDQERRDPKRNAW
jgi:hypothetical protein